MNINEHEFAEDLPFPETGQTFEYKRLLQELKTHQIELEMQNDELRRTEAKLRETSKRFADLYDFAPIAYLTLTGRGVIQELNLKASSLVGRPRIYAIGSIFYDYIYESDQLQLSQHLKDVLNAKNTLTCNLRLIGEGGKVFEAELESSAWWDDKQQRTLVRSIISDISDWKTVESELKAERDRAETASRIKSQFLANMSHEMRTPLGIIIGFTQLLIERAHYEKADLDTGLQTIHRNGVHLLSLIDDLLDLAKVEEGKMTIERLELDLRDEMNAMVQPFKQKANEKGLTFDIEQRGVVPAKIRTDPLRFRQIVLNILSNAVKFTSRGGIKIKVFHGHEAEPSNQITGNQQLWIEITDTGIGIPPEQRAMLFRAFSQADPTTTRRFGGTGLGLCLAKRLAEALGGDVSLLQSETNCGSTFRISIDSGAQESDRALPPEQGVGLPTVAKAEAVADRPYFGGLHVLLVEDGADNRFLIRTLLEQNGAEVTCVDNGKEAIKNALSDHFDVVLMDIQLPQMDGYTATTRLREEGYTSPIIAITAHALQEDRVKAQESGFDAYFSKPLNWNELVETISRYTDGRGQLH